MKDDKFVHLYPLERIHEGTKLGNAYLGLETWGHDDTILISIGCAELWDHRGGMAWKECHTLKNIREALENKDKARITELFASDTESIPGVPNRPCLLPCGRLVVTLKAGCKLVRNELARLDGGLSIVYTKDGVEKSAILRLDMTGKVSFALQCEDVEAFQLLDSYHLSGDKLKNISFQEPLRVERAGFQAFAQALPVDPGFGVAVRQDGDLLTGFFARAPEVASLLSKLEAAQKVDFAALTASNTKYWNEFWDKVPVIHIDNETLTDLYYDGLYQFQSMTAPDGYPAGLQGPWIEDFTFPPWSGDYHFNINVEMCYWPAYRSGLWANLRLVLDLVWSWRDRLRQNAKYLVGIDDGYVLPHAVDDHGTCMGSFWPGTIDHGCTAWVAQMMFDYCDYSSDFDYLRNVAFDFMKGAMRVYYAMLERKDGKLFMPVSTSPEYGGNEITAWGHNASFQLAACHRLARNLCKAAELLGEPEDPMWRDVMENLPLASLMDTKDGSRLGAWGGKEIALWDGLLLEESHRHHAHLAGINPFDILDKEDPEWAQIISNTIRRWIYRGRGLWSGWCVPWAGMICSHLDSPDAAELHLMVWKRAFTNPGGGSLHNCIADSLSLINWGGANVMQMDGSMGATAAVQDMFVHNRQEYLHVFPGISRNYHEASFERMPAPGGFLVSAKRTMEGGQVTITASRDNTLNLAFHGRDKVTKITQEMKAGETRQFDI